MQPSLWLGRLANLNAARTAARGIAPHKPLMLLTVIDLIESGDKDQVWERFTAEGNPSQAKAPSLLFTFDP